MSSDREVFTRAKIATENAVFEFEGTEDFVTAQLREYGETILELMSDQLGRNEATAREPKDELSTAKRTVKRKAKKKTSGTNSDVSNGVNPDNPSLDKNLDTSGIKEFYGKYEPRNHPEKILVFMRFLKDEAGIDNPNTDQIYTCYNAVGEKPAAAFAQSFRDTSSKKHGFIDYNSANEISLTFIGNRYFDHELKKKRVMNERGC